MKFKENLKMILQEVDQVQLEKGGYTMIISKNKNNKYNFSYNRKEWFFDKKMSDIPLKVWLNVVTSKLIKEIKNNIEEVEKNNESENNKK